jgi:hypothetical protein
LVGVYLCSRGGSWAFGAFGVSAPPSTS